MADRGIHHISRWKAVWNARLIFSCVALATALTVFFSAIILRFSNGGWIWVPVVIIFSVLIAYILLYKKITDGDVTSYIDKSFPAVEDSASLLLKPEEELNYFERRQIKKINRQWTGEILIPGGITRRFHWSIGSLITAAVFALLIYFIPIDRKP